MNASSRRTAEQRPFSVEFIDEQDEAKPPVLPERAAHRTRWLTRAVILSLVVAVATVWVTTREEDTRSSNIAPPAAHNAAAPSPARDIRYTVLPGAVPKPLALTITRALPGVAIDDVAVRVRPTVRGRDRAITWSVDARYRRLLISLDIAPSSGATRVTTRTVTSGASDVYIVHNREQPARRTVTISVIAPHGAYVPQMQLERMANQLARLTTLQTPPPSARRSGG